MNSDIQRKGDAWGELAQNLQVENHTCIICNKTFTTKSNLRAHTLTHVDESQQELFNCPFKECSRSYHYKKNLNHHIKTFHEKARNTLELNCTEPGCQAVLSSYVCLKRHYINVHKSKFKRKSARRVRRDKGKPKKAMIELLLGKHLSDDNRNAILQSQKTEMDLGHTKKKKSKSHENNGCINKMFSTAVKNGTELNLTDKSSQCEEYTGNFIWEPGDEFSNEKLSDCRSKVIDDCSHSIQEEPTILDKDDSIKNSLQIEINVKSSQEIAEVSSNNDDFDLILLRECAETLERLKRCIG